MGRELQRAYGWPLPGHGSTHRRFRELSAVSRRDLVIGRLVEAHADALAILSEGAATEEVSKAGGQRWGVWAAGPPTSLQACRSGGSWVVGGEKRWCSGATLLSHALVDAATAAGQSLFAVDLADPGVEAGPAEWATAGMAGADTRTVRFHKVPAVAVGEPGWYLERPGFWTGAIGVAACWHGGAIGVADALARAATRHGQDPHLLAHLGAVHTAIEGGRALLEVAARQVDEEPAANHAILARTVRSAVEREATAVIDRVGRALGPAPLAQDGEHAQRVVDLQVYVRQHHAERDLAALGADLAADPPEWR